MHLPYIQVEQDAIEDGRRMARLLGTHDVHGVGLVTCLIQWGLKMAPDGDFSGCIRDPHPQELVAAALGWPLEDAARLWVALERMGFTQSAAASALQCDRLRGLERYRRAWEKNQRRKPSRSTGQQSDSRDGLPETGATGAGFVPVTGTNAAGNRHQVPETGASSAGNRAEPARQTQTQTQKKRETTTVVASASPPAGSTATPGLSLRDRMEAVWLEKRGHAYVWRTQRDDPAVRELLALANGDEEEVLRRLGNGLPYRFPLCTGIPALAKNWDTYAVPEAPPGAGAPRAPPPGASVGRAPGGGEACARPGCGGTSRGGRVWGLTLCAPCTEELLRAMGTTPSEARAREWARRQSAQEAGHA